MTRSKRGVELARLGALGGEASDNQDAEEKKGKKSRSRGGHPVHTVYSMNSKVAWGEVELGTETGEEGRGKRRGPWLRVRVCVCALACQAAQAWAQGSGLVSSDLQARV